MRAGSIAVLTICSCLAAGCELGPASTPEDQGPALGSTSQELLGGEIAGPDDDPAVVALVNSFGPFCTGSLVTPRAILTAAHCIDQFNFSNPSLGIFFGSDIEDGVRFGVTGGATKPGWDGVVGVDKPDDIGLLLLTAAQPPSLPLPMNTRNPESGESYRHVGFGVYENGLSADGKKRQGTVNILDVGAGIISSGTDELSVCFGDSGGPAFVVNDGVEHIAGVHSFTSTSGGGCRAPAGDARVDVALDWIREWLDKNDPSCGPDRICSQTGCSNDPDCASCGADGVCAVCAEPDPDCPNKPTGTMCQQRAECNGDICTTWDGDFASKFCSETCSSDDDCPDDMECRLFSNQNLCYYKDAPPGRLGASCETADECFSNRCDDEQCVVTCNISLGYDCPADFSCTEDDSGLFFCRPDQPLDEGGCNSGGRPGGLAGLLMALAALGLLGAGRRRA